MKSAIAIVVTMAVLLTGAAAQAGTDFNSTTAENSNGASGVSNADQALGACEFQYVTCLNNGGSSMQCNAILVACLLEKLRTEQPDGNDFLPDADYDGDGISNREDVDDDRDTLLPPELEAVVVKDEPMSPRFPWDTQSTGR